MGLPAGSAAAVDVTGPEGYSQAVSGTQTLTQLAPGTYTVAASAVTVNATLYSASPASQSLAVGGAAASAQVTYAANVGALFVNINGLPTNQDAAVTVTGPNGYNQAVVTTTNLGGLAPGAYTITAQAVTAAGGGQYTPDQTTLSASVVVGATASKSVTYVPPEGGSLNLRIDGMYLTQSTQTYTGDVPLVQNRDGFLRVFVVANQPNVVVPAVRVRFYRNLVFQSQVEIPAPGVSVPTAADESSLSHSWNVPVSGSMIQPGLSIVAEVDPSNSVLEANEHDNASPAGDPLPLEVRSTPMLNVTFVPVIQRRNLKKGNVTIANKDQFLEMTGRMHPIASYNSIVHAAYTTNTMDTLQNDNGNSAWGTILGEIDAVRTAEHSSRYYFGVAKVSYSSGVAGVAYVSTQTAAARAALGWDFLPSASDVVAHELGHNWGRNHAPCGNPTGLDTQYPHPDGSTGVYGLDVATQTLQPPTSSDIMGYCDPKWISDYTYKAVLNYLSPASPIVMSAAVSQSIQPCLLVWGHIQNGEVVLEPAFQIDTRPSLPERAGPYSVEARAADGSALFSLSFAPYEIADAPGSHQNFAFAVPLSADKAARISTLRLSGRGREAVAHAQARTAPSAAQLQTGALPDSVEVRRMAGGQVGVKWDARAHPMVMVRDPETGEVLSLARGGDVQISTAKGQVDLVISDGVKSRLKRVTVAP